MPVPVELIGSDLTAYRVNADRVAIANTDRPWLYASGHEGIEGVRLKLFMSDKEGIVVFPSNAPKLDAVLEPGAWERRYAVPAGAGGSLFLSHDRNSLYIGYEIVPPLDRRGKRQPWQAKGNLPYANRFAINDKASDTTVWQVDSLVRWHVLLGRQVLTRATHAGNRCPRTGLHSSRFAPLRFLLRHRFDLKAVTSNR